MSKEFLQWVEEVLRQRVWRNADLAREGEMSESMVSRVLNRGSRVSYDFCNGVARAFKVRPEPLYRHAGLTPPLPAQQANEQRIIHAYRTLDPADRSVITRAITCLAGECIPANCQTGPPGERKELISVLGDSVLKLEHPIRVMYEALADIMTPEQLAQFVARLAERAALNEELVQRGSTNEQQCEDRTVSGGDRTAKTVTTLPSPRVDA